MNFLKELSAEGLGSYKENELATVYSLQMTIRFQKRELQIDYDSFSLNVIHDFSTEPLRNGSAFNVVRITKRGYSFNLINNSSFDSKFILYPKSWLRKVTESLFNQNHNNSFSFLHKYKFKGNQTLSSKIKLDEDINEFLIENEVNIISEKNTYLVTINPKEEVINFATLKSYIEFVKSLGQIINQ
jgi:hypothetical protein